MIDFKRWYELLEKPDQNSLAKSIGNCHADGLFSLVFGGTENGRLVRAFIATKKIKPADIALHTHRYPLTLGVVAGSVTHHLAYDSGKGVDGVAYNRMPTYNYKSPLNGGCGLKYTGNSAFYLEDYVLPRGCLIDIGCDDLHSVSCSKGSIWIVQEHGFVTDSSVVVGAPFEVDGLYTEPKQFQVNDMHKVVKNAVFNLLQLHSKYSGDCDE